MNKPLRFVTRAVPVYVAGVCVIASIAFPPPELRAQASTGAPLFSFNAFGARLLSTAANRAGAADSNTVVSPLSAGLALSLTSFGANGNTAAALASMLGTSAWSRSGLERRGAALIDTSANRKDVQLEIANAVWTDNSVTPTTTFQASARAWHARIGSLSLHSPGATATINNWADSATHGKIKKILTGTLPDTTLLFVANAVYFKGKWITPFNNSLTQKRAFTTGSGHTIQAASMQRTGGIGYSRDSGYQMVRLPYEGNHVAMYVILPDSGDNGRIERRFAQRGWPASLSAHEFRQVHLVLPKLHVEQGIDLLPLIQRLGAGVATDCKQADFSGLAVDKSGRPPHQLCIGKAFQKVYLDVDEQGTEAAAVTGVGMVTTTALRLTTEFVVDRPFIILIRDETTGSDLFVGSIRHP